MTAITSSNLGKSLNDLTIPTSQRTSGRNMTQQDFLKIMIEQLKSQNPLEPSDNNQFFSQMVQFQSLDAMTAMQKSIEALSQVSSLSSATALIGKTVTAGVSPGDDPITGTPLAAKPVTGKVLNVTFDPSNGAVLHLDNNVAAPASAVTKVQ